jgi:hypothetical protein
MYSKAWMAKCLSDTYPVKNGMKQRHDFLPLLFKFPLEHAIKKVQEN